MIRRTNHHPLVVAPRNLGPRLTCRWHAHSEQKRHCYPDAKVATTPQIDEAIGIYGHASGSLTRDNLLRTSSAASLAPRALNALSLHQICAAIDDLSPRGLGRLASTPFRRGMTRQAVRDAPEYDSTAALNREQELHIHKHYGRIGYWRREVQYEASVSPVHAGRVAPEVAARRHSH